MWRAQLRGSAILLHLSLGRRDKDLADTTLGMIGDFEVAWLTEDKCQRLTSKGCVRVMPGRGVVESPPIMNSPRLRIRLIRIRTHVIFPIDKTYVHGGNSFVVFAA